MAVDHPLHSRYPRPLKFHARSGDILLFLHLPHTTGTAFFNLLAANFAAEEICSITAPFNTEIEVAAALHHLSHARLVRGYLDYESYRYLPRTPIYLTMLRHPIDRVIALYHAVQRDASHPLHHRALALSLHDFVCNPECNREIVNAQVWRLATSQWRDRGSLSDQTVLEMAKVNLNEFAFFGIAERWSTLPYLLAYTLDWSLPIGPLDQWLPMLEANLQEGVDQATLEAIRERTQLDQLLYDEACTIFDQRCHQMMDELIEQSHLWNHEYARKLGDYQHVQASWSWRVLEKLKSARRILIPPESRRESLYQMLGERIFGQKSMHLG